MKIRGAVLERLGSERPFAATRPITVTELELDDPGATEVRVRVECAGICHSDLSVVTGDRPRPTPMLLGHEASGIVEIVGDAVSEVAVGDRVVITFLPRCGECAGCATGGRLPCERGSAANESGRLLSGGRRLHRGDEEVFHHLGVSGFATHAVVDERSVVRVDPDVPAEIASLLGCAVLTGGGAVLNAQFRVPEKPVIIVGLGGVGMAALLVARALGHPTIGVDSTPEKLLRAAELGAVETYTPQDALEEQVQEHLVIEAAGNARAFETAVDLTAPGGQTVTVGLPPRDARSSISPLKLVAGARTITGSYLGSSDPKRDVPRYAKLWQQGDLPIDQLISDRVPLGQINEAMDALAEGRVLRQLIEFD